MKKRLFFLLTVTLIVFLAVGCGGGDDVVENPGETDGDGEGSEYADGTYVAYSNSNPRGYVMAEVTIADGVIADVALTEYNDKGQEKDENYSYEAQHTAMEELPGQFIESNSADVDGVSEATSTSEKSMDAVAKALERSKGFDGTFEGMFMGISEVSERGGWGVALVVLDADGNIEEVTLKEVAGDDFKDEDYGYEAFHEAVEEMAKRFVEANSSDVDAFTGATGSSVMWAQAVEDAIQKAQ